MELRIIYTGCSKLLTYAVSYKKLTFTVEREENDRVHSPYIWLWLVNYYINTL